MKILAISGSLRATSLNTVVLRAAGRLAPAGVAIELFEGIGGLPFFNSDLEGERLPRAVAEFRAAIGAADGLLISSPEYARGVSGVTKNALDWLHSLGDREPSFLHDKVIGLISAAGGTRGRAPGWSAPGRADRGGARRGPKGAKTPPRASGPAGR